MLHWIEIKRKKTSSCSALFYYNFIFGTVIIALSFIIIFFLSHTLKWITPIFSTNKRENDSKQLCIINLQSFPYQTNISYNV